MAKLLPSNSLVRWPLVLIAAVFALFPALCQRTYFDALTGVKKAVRSPNRSTGEVATEVIRVFGDVNSYPLSSVRDILMKEHEDWKANAKPALDEGKLVASLNAHLNLDGSAEYLKLHTSELRRMRVFLWTQVPDLNGDFGSRKLSQGGSVVTTQIPPMEAFLSVGLLIYQKMLNPVYLQTDEERRADTFGLMASQLGTSSGRMAPAVLQARQQQFQGRVRDFALSHWLAGSTSDEIMTILSESR